MKKIVLIGDSIRMGYDKYVKDALKGVAEVYFPEENCKYALNVLRFVHEWKENLKWGDDVDLVHWNAGLWDALELFNDEPLTPIHFYKELIVRIDKRLRLIFPKAKFVFATSTAIMEDSCPTNFVRHNDIIEDYNKTAIEALVNTNEIINDLFYITKNCSKELHSDCTHFYTNDGTKLIGDKVLKVICEQLGIFDKINHRCNFKYNNPSSNDVGI